MELKTLSLESKNYKMDNIFKKEISDTFINRINTLTAETKPQWGSMNVAQMLAHCNVSYEMVFTNKHKKATGFKRVMLKAFVKPIVCNDKAYKKNGRTAPAFLMVDEKEFDLEKSRLIEHIQKSQELGAKHFENIESNSFGKLTTQEWNNMFCKHLEHHLSQFGA